jgi:hypothetical protein
MYDYKNRQRKTGDIIPKTDKEKTRRHDSKNKQRDNQKT